MKYINKITSDAFQQLILTGNPGQRITMDLRFMPTQNSWIANITYGDIEINGIYICVSGNLLNGFKNIIPFGISCLTDDQIDPATIDDFESGYARLYLLDSDDLAYIEDNYFE